MSDKKINTVERLRAADPALSVTDDELARSRQKSLAVMHAEAIQIATGGAMADFHRPHAKRRFRLVAGFGLAAAAVLAGVFVASSMSPSPMENAAPVATQPAVAPETGSPEPPPLPEITDAKAPTGGAEVVTGGNGNKAAVSTDQGVNVFMDALNTGRLGVNSAGCIARVGTDGSASGLLFPYGTKVTETGVVLPDGTSINIGQEFAFGGGLSPGSPNVGQCFPTGEAFLVQSWGPNP